MKSTFLKTIAASLLVSANIFCLVGAHAQSPCIKTNTLVINTGIDANDTKILYAPSGIPDPFWTISAQTGAVPTGVTPGSPAIITTNSVVGTDPNSNLISYSAAGGPTGYVTTPANTTFGAFSLTFRRTFTTCVSDELSFYFDLAFDNYLVDLLIDGVAIPGATTFPTTAAPGFYQWGNIYTSTQSLAAGTHTIEIRIGNQYATYSNPTMLNVRGSITGTTNSLVANNSSPDCVCMDDGCNDLCYWKVSGNTILNGNNKLGTVSNHDVDILTNGADRGVFTATGLLGWNTMNPTAYLHVYCDGHNKPDGKISDVRFEKLEPGGGSVLVINEDGYVLDSKIAVSSLAEEMKTLRQKYESVERELQDVKKQLNTLSLQSSGAKSGSSSKLYQNKPNPSSKETWIDFYIDQMTTNAFIVVYDLNGKEVKRFLIADKGAGNVQISATTLPPGMYVYSLIVDGTEIDTKKMVLNQ